MDPSSAVFTPSYSHTPTPSNTDSNWRLQADVEKMRVVQAEHTERLTRLERRQDDDGRRRSVWGSQSPFPSILSGGGLGTPMQSAMQQSSTDQFRNFDDEGNAMMSSLHLDSNDDAEPRSRLGAASRAASVRFDETANQNHFSSSHSHSSRPSVDYLSRTPGGSLGTFSGLAMNERTASHKSEGRASSAHSIRSAGTSGGRANSLVLDSFGIGSESPRDGPALAPGLLLLGAVPAIIRCWMNTNFKHDALLYAAVCTGSHKSYLDLRLIRKLGFEDQITADDGASTVELPVYFPEAVPHPSSSRSTSPAPQLPTLTIPFQVVDASSSAENANLDSKAIQIFIGSDVLRAHCADILFSSNSISLFDDDGSKLSIPLVRPEDESSFNTLATGSAGPRKAVPPPIEQSPYLNGLGGQGSSSMTSMAPPPGLTQGRYRPPGVIAAEAGATTSSSVSDRDLVNSRPGSRQSTASASRPNLSRISTGRPTQDTQDLDTPAPATLASLTESSTPSNGLGNSSPSLRASSGTSSGIWGNWRTPSVSTSITSASTPLTATANASTPVQNPPTILPNPSAAPSLDWSNVSSAASKPKDTTPSSDEKLWTRKREAGEGIKVLKPKSTSRTASTASVAGAASPAEAGNGGKSRFFEEGRQKVGDVDKKENAANGAGNGGTGVKRGNPVGGASAFSWLAK
ncbi:hypothetical protein LTR95_002803 [Oleoguttula sp. CCFEE 5521]